MSFGGKFGRSAESEEEEEASWTESYSDLMTDLLAIFVVLFSFAMINQAIVASKAAEPTVVENILPGGDSIINAILSYIDQGDASDELSVTVQADNTILLRVPDSVLFDPGRADISSKAEQVLASISGTLTRYAGSIKMVRIEGHTDSVPISNGQFRNNWELSTSRAVSVLERLVRTSELEPGKFSAVGYGEFHPISPNSTLAGRAQNRRVDIIIETVQGE